MQCLAVFVRIYLNSGFVFCLDISVKCLHMEAIFCPCLNLNKVFVILPEMVILFSVQVQKSRLKYF